MNVGSVYLPTCENADHVSTFSVAPAPAPAGACRLTLANGSLPTFPAFFVECGVVTGYSTNGDGSGFIDVAGGPCGGAGGVGSNYVYVMTVATGPRSSGARMMSAPAARTPPAEAAATSGKTASR